MEQDLTLHERGLVVGVGVRRAITNIHHDQVDKPESNLSAKPLGARSDVGQPDRRGRTARRCEGDAEVSFCLLHDRSVAWAPRFAGLLPIEMARGLLAPLVQRILIARAGVSANV